MRHVVFREGDAGDKFYVILRGRVAVDVAAVREPRTAHLRLPTDQAPIPPRGGRGHANPAPCRCPAGRPRGRAPPGGLFR